MISLTKLFNWNNSVFCFWSHLFIAVKKFEFKCSMEWGDKKHILFEKTWPLCSFRTLNKNNDKPTAKTEWEMKVRRERSAYCIQLRRNEGKGGKWDKFTQTYKQTNDRTQRTQKEGRRDTREIRTEFPSAPLHSQAAGLEEQRGGWGCDTRLNKFCCSLQPPEESATLFGQDTRLPIWKAKTSALKPAATASSSRMHTCRHLPVQIAVSIGHLASTMAALPLRVSVMARSGFRDRHSMLAVCRAHCATSQSLLMMAVPRDRLHKDTSAGGTPACWRAAKISRCWRMLLKALERSKKRPRSK